MNGNNIPLKNIVPEDTALTVDCCETVAHALEVMDHCHRHAVGVTVNGFFTGLFTRSDFIKRVVRRDLDPHRIAVGSVMTVNPVVISADSGAKESYYLMCYEGYSHLPVINENRLVGIIAEHDLRQEIACDLKNANKHNQLMESMLREPYGLCASY